MSSTIPRTSQLALSPPEDLFRRCLLGCRDHMQDVPGMKDLELRWTGGWVRDKLLKTPSHDIDVALSTMTGEQFGKALQIYMKKNSDQYTTEAEAQGISPDIKDLHKIKANPEKSKNLETITTRMFGLDVDFVNLRKEVYTADSRNPQMEFGTPEEDASRRDACVNALFYNLDTQQVEDFTGRGLDDMKAKLIRTPLEPTQTFLDDPLRVLRLIRFAARLGYTIHADARKAMADPEIHEALRRKISRERVGVEIGKIMTGPDPARGLGMIAERDLYTTVFADPQAQPDDLDKHGYLKALHYTDMMLTENPPSIVTGKFLDALHRLRTALKIQDDLTATWSLAAYVPFRHDEALAVNAAREGIKATNLIIRLLSDSIKNVPRTRHICDTVNNGSATRSDVGMNLRSMGKSWRLHVFYCFLCDVVEDRKPEIRSASVLDRYNKLLTYSRNQELDNVAEMKQILNGNEIKNALEVAKAGPWLKDAIDKVAAWQFANPEGTRDDAVAWIKEHKDELQAG